MAKRKPISKKLRFEVFKRDKFTCQYCGKSAPDVVLEVDHIKPVAKGGTNDIMNLVTSCMECNRGKSDKELSDDSTLQKQLKQIEELSTRREQIEMMLEWRESLNELHNDCVEKIVEAFDDYTDFIVNDHGRKKIKKWLKEFTFEEVFEALYIAVDTYYDGSEESCNVAFNKITGICHNRRLQKTDRRVYYCNYIVKAMANKGWYCNRGRVEDFVYGAVETEEDFELAKWCLRRAGCWSSFWDYINNNFESNE